MIEAITAASGALPDLLLPSLVAIATNMLLMVVATIAFVIGERRSINFQEREAKLPEATRWADLSARVEDLQIEHDNLKDQIINARSIIEEAERKRDRLDEIDAALRDKEQDYAELQKVQADLTQDSEQLAAAREEIARLNLEKTKTEFEHERLRDDSDRLERRIDEQKSEAVRADDRVQELSSREDEARSALKEIERDVQSRRTEEHELNLRRGSLESEISRLRKEIESLSSARNHLQEAVESSQSREAELKADIQGLERRLRHEQDHLSAIREKVGASDPAGADARHVLQELWVPEVDSTEFGDTDEVESRANETEALAKVHGYLQAHGLRFPERVVNAFHTALKCADDTPLLVLAGISGTGKSLLPRRYAEAMGIHFVHLPVQPRWDGPQDLLGFYNYLENRYKATPLLRALLQLDPSPRSWKRPEYVDASDHMLLVLLDEMNLARVEYYFSEFLSRLEMRRDIDRDDPIDVRKAEIPVEVGRLPSIAKDDPVRVFVDSNVLFVGTINEDESTLSLSDKVVDRANIMRFGRPQNLAELPSASDDTAHYRAEQALSASAWSEWTRAEGGGNMNDDHDALIGRLNDALERVGRPFGYRTRRAILRYLRMYPDSSDVGAGYALADQIEQRILPKLRGVDKTDPTGKRAIDDVIQLIGEAGDEELQAAVHAGTDGGDLFAWHGIDRR